MVIAYIIAPAVLGAAVGGFVGSRSSKHPVGWGLFGAAAGAVAAPAAFYAAESLARR